MGKFYAIFLVAAFLLVGSGSSAYAQQHPQLTSEQMQAIRQAQQQAQHMMQSPEMQAYMQKMQAMSPAEREAYQRDQKQKAEGMQHCMEGIMGSPAEQKAEQARVEAEMAQVKALCHAGQQAQAEAAMRDMAMKSMNDPRRKMMQEKMQECSKKYPLDMPPMDKSFIRQQVAPHGKPGNFCDSYNK